MKKTLNYLFAALTFIVSVSCTKCMLPDESDAVSEARTLTATFACDNLSTKTSTTDGKTPLWAAGDKVMFSDGSNKQEFTLVSETPDDKEAQITAEGSSFTATIPSGWGSTIYAVYPSSSYVRIENGEIRFSIPTQQDGTFASANICAAKTTGSSLEFKNVTAVVKFTSVAGGIDYVVLPAAKIAGTYQVTPGSAPVPVSGKDHITITTTGTEYYAAVAPVTVPSGTSVLFEDAAWTIVGSKKTSNTNTFVINKIYSLGAITKNSVVPDGMLKYAFSVSATDKIHFSKGNLYYNGSAWAFEDKQYDYRTYGEKYACIDGSKTDSGTPAGHWGLFGWSTDAASNNWGMHTITSATSGYTDGNFKDWGKNVIANGGNTAEQWSAMSGGADGNWAYLLNSRSGSTVNGVNNARYCKATVNSVPGMILFPDSYTHPSGVTAPTDINSTSAAFSNLSYDASQWIKMESAGCVFLPAVGYRSGTKAINVGLMGRYWSSSPNATVTNYAYHMYFYNNGVDPAQNQGYRYNGFSVRLVCAAD